MKLRRSAPTGLCVLSICTTVILAGCPQDPAHMAPPAEQASVDSETQTRPFSTPVPGVGEFMRGVDEHRQGTCAVQGVVSATSPAEKMFAVVDFPNEGSAADCADCTTTCAPPILPVRWEGPIPKVQDTVRIEGTIEETNGKLIFVATKIDRPGSEP